MGRRSRNTNSAEIKTPSTKRSFVFSGEDDARLERLFNSWRLPSKTAVVLAALEIFEDITISLETADIIMRSHDGGPERPYNPMLRKDRKSDPTLRSKSGCKPA